MRSTRFTDLVGCSFPIQQAGMGYLHLDGRRLPVARFSGVGIDSETRRSIEAMSLWAGLGGGRSASATATSS